MKKIIFYFKRFLAKKKINFILLLNKKNLIKILSNKI